MQRKNRLHRPLHPLQIVPPGKDLDSLRELARDRFGGNDPEIFQLYFLRKGEQPRGVPGVDRPGLEFDRRMVVDHTFPKQSTQLWPPKPKELDRAAVIGARRATFGT